MSVYQQSDEKICPHVHAALTDFLKDYRSSIMGFCRRPWREQVRQQIEKPLRWVAAQQYSCERLAVALLLLVCRIAVAYLIAIRRQVNEPIKECKGVRLVGGDRRVLKIVVE